MPERKRVEVITGFGDARLMPTSDFKYELRGGSELDQKTAKESLERFIPDLLANWHKTLDLAIQMPLGYCLQMSTLSEIEAAADALTADQKQELLLFLAARLRAQGAKLPEPRKFSREQIADWIARDEADMQQFREGK